MKIFLATDHAGFKLKESIKEFLKEHGYTVADEGAFRYDESDDYPDFISVAAKQVASSPTDHRAIVFGGSGTGEAIVANREHSIRAVAYYGGNEDILRLSRTHNDANILALGARFLKEEEAKRAILLWLGTDFPGEDRHIRRNVKIDNPGDAILTL
jgi:ribose 5-phosphate isomerase B